MAETQFQRLSAEERRQALRTVQAEGPHPAFLFEKDIWVVATLGVLFDAPFGQRLVFKGGTSLSKVWRAIRRFSEDIDSTYDIRSFAPDLVAGAGDEALPPSRSQEEALDEDDPFALGRMGPGDRWSAHRGATWARRVHGAHSCGSRAALRRLRTAVRVVRSHSAGGSGRLRGMLHGRAACCPRGRVRCRRIPAGAAQEVLADDYAGMLGSGMLLEEDEPFDALMDRCAMIEARANASPAAEDSGRES